MMNWHNIEVAMKIQNTARKLREAHFFLGELKKASRPKDFDIHHPSHLRLNILINAGRDVELKIDNEKFQFYLSAFLSSGRSVTFVLQKEEKEEYDSIFPEWFKNLSSEDQDIFETMNSQRVAEVHQLGVNAVVRKKEIIVNKGVPRQTIISVPVWHFTDQPSQIIELCTRYINLLEKLIQQFSQ
jgi:hypothetical protein